SNILAPSTQSFGERWAYLPSAGFCLAAALAFDWLWTRQKIAAVALLGIVVAAASVRTVIRNRDWRDNFTLAAASVRAYPQCIRAQHALGLEYLKRGDLPNAMKHFAAAEQITEDYPH